MRTELTTSPSIFGIYDVNPDMHPTRFNADPYLRLDPNPDLPDPDLDRSTDLTQTQTVQDKLS
jgi:hypothetical protein